MSFTGFSSDDEGSIVYDGKKFIVTNPRQVPDDFNPGDKEVVGLPENHPSHPKNRQPSPIPKYVPPAVIYTAFDKHRAEEHQKRVQKAGDSGKPKEKEKPAQEVAQPTLPPDYVGDIPESPLVFEQSWTKKLSEGQKLQIDYLLSNEGSTDTGIINIPLPGWYLDNRNMYRIAALDGRTLLYYADNVVTQWQELSPTEQKIEMALTATANADAGEANFDNIQSFDDALDWITHNKGLINIYADNAQVPEEILRVILTSEILYDYGALDAWQDAAVRHNIPLSIDIGWQATGVANVHYATLIEAYHYIASRLPESVEHPWDLDPNAPDLSGFPTLDLDEQTEQELEELPTDERDAEIFRQRETRYGELTYNQKKAVAIYLVTNEGTINAASMVTSMYLDQYITQKWKDPQNFAEIAENLSPKDVARIWGRYRSAYEPLDAAVFGPNAQLARPIAEYLLG